LSTSALGGYYARRFGRVRGDPSRHVIRTSVKWSVVYPAITAAMIVDLRFIPAVVVSGLAFAVAIEAFRQSTGGGRRHYIIAAIGLVAFSLLPLSGVLPPGKDSLTPLIGIIGLIYIVGGILDHRELVRILAPTGEERHVAAV
jgi:FtsH-binding integral membrane protein